MIKFKEMTRVSYGLCMQIFKASRRADQKLWSISSRSQIIIKHKQAPRSEQSRPDKLSAKSKE